MGGRVMTPSYDVPGMGELAIHPRFVATRTECFDKWFHQSGVMVCGVVDGAERRTPQGRPIPGNMHNGSSSREPSLLLFPLGPVILIYTQ